MRYVWDEDARSDYVRWQSEDRRVLRRINDLLRDVARGTTEGRPHDGIGKPEALRYLQGYWSRRITDEHRLVYKVVGQEVRIAACRYHYGR